eukprot:s2038_g18.t1
MISLARLGPARMSSSLKRSWSDRSCQTRIQKCWFPVKVYWDTGRLGMKLVEQDGVLVVRRTQKGTWADEMKLRIGDELVSINGQAVSQMREEDCRDTLLWRRPLRLTFARLCRASATPRLRNRTAARLDEALSFSQSQLQLHAPLPEVVRSRAESLEVRADEVGEDRAVDAVVTALLHTLEDPEKKQEIQNNARTEDLDELAAEVHKEDAQITDPAEPAKPMESGPEPSQPSEPAEPTLPADAEPREPRERQYSDFEEFENDEPSEYEDVFEIDDEENTPANKESGSSNPKSGYPGTMPAIAAPSMANLETEASQRRVVFAEQETREDSHTVLEGGIGHGEANAQANHPLLEKKVSFSDDAGVDAATAKAMRKGTGFVSKEDLPESEDDEEDETDEIEVPPGYGERKVSFSQEAGTDSERVQAMRKGTGFVDPEDAEDTYDDEEFEDEA